VSGLDDSDSDFDPDSEETAPVENKEMTQIGTTPPKGGWRLKKKDKQAARLALRREAKPVKQRVKRKENTRKGREQRLQATGELTAINPGADAAAVASVIARTHGSIGVGVGSLNINKAALTIFAHAPSISTGLASLGIALGIEEKQRE
jgi:hypothetical protein